MNIIDVKQAAGLASQYVNNLYAEQMPSPTQLEEVELTEDGKYWLITVSFVPRASTPIEQALSTPKRVYKLFKINAQTGQMVSMKIRTVDRA